VTHFLALVLELASALSVPLQIGNLELPIE
jgi:hypothetical protein